MKVKALRMGYIKGRIVPEGAIFELPAGLKKGSWMQEVVDKAAKPEEKKLAPGTGPGAKVDGKPQTEPVKGDKKDDAAL